MDRGFFGYLKGKRRYAAVAVLILIGLLLIALPFSKEETEISDEQTLEEYKERMEEEVSALASSVRGVGKCRVYITFERGEQNTYKGSEVIERKPPLVLGVAVVCAGADNDRVRSDLVEMMTSLFEIPSSRVAVLKMR